MNNKIYLILLITALFAGANIQKANALEEFPELLPASAVDVRRMILQKGRKKRILLKFQTKILIKKRLTAN